MQTPPRISVVVPVLNEAADINKVIGHLRALPSEIEPEIIVMDGDPRAGTVKAITHNRVISASAPVGRASQMNAGAALAKGAVLLFLHADTFLPHDAFARIDAAMRDQKTVGGAFDLGILSERRIFRITECYAAARTRITRVPFGDQAIFLRKGFFHQIGGYQDMPIMEDVELMTRIRRQGGRIRIIAEKVMTSPRRWEEEGVLRCTLRNWKLQLLYCWGVPAHRLARFYRARGL